MTPITQRRIPAVLVACLLLLPLAGPLLAAKEGAGERRSAWQEWVRRDPGVVDDEEIGLLERRILDVLTPAQAVAFQDGADPATIPLAGGGTLADFLADALTFGPGLVYETLPQCIVFSTAGTAAGAMAANEVREFFARGADLSAQGGAATGCGVPTEAVAVVLHLRVVAAAVADGVGALKVWPAGDPEPSTKIRDYEPIIDPPMAPRRRFSAAAVAEICVGACASGDLAVKTADLGGQVRGDVAGFFRPAVASDLPTGPGSGFDADTLDGLEATALAAAAHTHAGEDVDSGTVDEPFIDPEISRDGEVFATLLAGDGSGSGVDLDTLDGLESTEFRPRAANVVLVGKNGCDFLTVQEALDAIGTTLPAATTSNRYLVRVGPGIYSEQVIMEPFVDIEGAGQHVTTITAASQAGPQGTVECADDAELRSLTVASTGGGEKAIAIRCLGASPMLTHVKATATGATGGTVPENIGLLNDGAAAKPVLTQMDAYAGNTVVVGIGVLNQNGAMPTIRDSRLAGGTAAIKNRDTATARLANTELMGPAMPDPPATQASFMCVRAYEAGTLERLSAQCELNTPPTATDDAYAALGNTLLEVTLDHAGAPSTLNTTATQPSVIGETTTPKTYRSVFENDTDAESPKSDLTAAVVPASVTAGATVNMFADGTFEYLPPVGAAGTDGFDYTVTDPGGLMDTGTVTIAFGDRIWYIDNTNAGTADGRSTSPYTSLAPIDAGGADDGKDGMDDTIFVFTGSGNTSGGILLEANQVLHGNEIALAPAGFEYAGGGDLVAASTAPTIEDTAGDVIVLASGNTVRGLDITATAGRAVFGSGVTDGTFDQVGTTGMTGGTGIRLDNATGTFTFSDLDVGSSTDAGIDIQGGSATFTFDSASSITNTMAPAFNVNGGSGNIDYDGTISQSNPFSAIKINGKTAGTVSFDGAVTANTATANGIDLTANGGGTFTFSGPLSLTTTTGTAFNATGGGTVQATNAGNTVNTAGDGIGSGVGVNIGDTIGGLGVGFNVVNVGSSGKASSGILLANTGGGAFSVTSGTIQNTTSRAFSANNVGGTVTIGAGLQNDGGRSVEIQGSIGSFTFSGLVNDDAQGINLSTNAGASFTFKGGIDADTVGANIGLRAFSGGTLEVCDDTNCDGSGAALTNTVDTATGVGVSIDQVTIGAGGVTFRSVSVNGAVNGIVLSTTGGGSFTVTGDGSTATQGGNDSGGIIQSTTGDGVALTSAQNVTLRNMTIGDPAATPADSPDGTNNIGGDGVRASGVTNLDLLNVTIARTGGHGVNATGNPSITNLTVDDSLILNAGDGQEEHGLNLDELRGDNFVRRSLFDGFNETGIELINASGTVDLTIDDTTFQDNQATVGNAGEEAILIEAQGTASIVVLVTGSTVGTQSIFDDIARQAIQAISLGSGSDIQLTVENSSFVETQAGDAVIIMNPDFSGSGNVTVKDNTFTDDSFGPFAVLAKNDSSGTLDATIQGNTVTNMQLLNVNHDNVGSGGAANGTSRILVGGTGMGEGNNVTVGSNNIAVDLIATESPIAGGAPDVSFTAHNNTTSQPDGNFTFTPGLRVDVQNATRLNANLTGNAFQGDPSFAGGSGIEVKEQDSSVVGLQGFAGGNQAAAQGFIDGANPASADASFVTSHDSNIDSGTATLPTATTLPSP